MKLRRKELESSGRTFKGGWKELSLLLNSEWKVFEIRQKQNIEKEIKCSLPMQF